jgi:hypothetical protein
MTSKQTNPEALESQPTWQHVLQFKITMKFEESYLPSPRHRKTAKRRAAMEGVFAVPFANRRDAPIAFSILERGVCCAYRVLNGVVYREAKRHRFGKPEQTMTLEELTQQAAYLGEAVQSLHWVTQRVQNFLEPLLIVKGVVYERSVEPVFELCPTELELLEDLPSSPFLRKNVFNLLEREAAMHCAQVQGFKLERYELPMVQLFKPCLVRQPSHAENVAAYEAAEVERTVQQVQSTLHQKPVNVQRSVLRALESLHAA